MQLQRIDMLKVESPILGAEKLNAATAVTALGVGVHLVSADQGSQIQNHPTVPKKEKKGFDSSKRRHYCSDGMCG